jgi:hypothetical protein
LTGLHLHLAGDGEVDAVDAPELCERRAIAQPPTNDMAPKYARSRVIERRR